MTTPLPGASDEPLQIDEPFDLRPMLDELGIVEVERGVCEDNFENRRVIREAKLQYVVLYANNGVPNGLIQVVSRDTAMMNRMTSLAQRKPILIDPKNLNSDYLTGVDLLAEEAGDRLAPPWVIGATKMWRREQLEPIHTDTRKPTALPHRCTHIKSDGIRCMLWCSGRERDNGLCRIHLRSIAHRPNEDIERARKRLVQAAPYAVDILEDLMQTAISEQVRLKASTEILDRAGIRGGIEIDAQVNHSEGRAPRDIITERLDNMRKNAEAKAAENVTLEIEDAEVVPTDELEVEASPQPTEEQPDA